jgi:hypothetical protein
MGGGGMKNYEWKSSLSEHIRKYIAFKKASGLKFARQETLLQFFDRFHFYGGYQGTEITREMAREFIFQNNGLKPPPLGGNYF